MKNLKPVTLSRLILLLITIFILTLFVTGCITNNKHEPPRNGSPTVQSSPVPPGKGTLIPQTSPQNKPSNSGLYPWGKNISLFLLGAMGALLTIYLGKQEVIPEFRPFLDTLDDEEEANELRDRIKKIQKYIDDNQSKLQKEPEASGGISENLKIENESLHKELKEERERLQLLEYRIKGSQVVARILGCLTYIVLGGIFGTLLAGKVKVEGLNGYLPEYFQSIVIGATWTTYLYVIGLSADRRKTAKNTTEQVQNVQKQIDETFWAYKQSKDIPEKMQDTINQNHMNLLKRVDRMKQVILRKM